MSQPIDLDLSKVKKSLRDQHAKLVSMVPKEERAALNQKIEDMISKAKSDNKNSFMENFMKDVYNR